MSHSLGIAKISQRTKRKTPSQYRSLVQLTVYNVITKNNLTCLMIYILNPYPVNVDNMASSYQC